MKTTKTQKYKRYKIVVNNDYHAKAIQKLLFELGYKWVSGDNPTSARLPFFEYVNDKVQGNFIYAYYGVINFGYMKSVFQDFEGEEVTIYELAKARNKITDGN